MLVRSLEQSHVWEFCVSQSPKILVMWGPTVQKNELEKNYFKNDVSKMISLDCAHYSHLSKHTA